jgi:molecular chaperone GrpE
VAEVFQQFTALRHDVNLQTRATRTLTEQTAELVSHLGKPTAIPAESTSPDLPGWIKALIEVEDSLSTAVRQALRSQQALVELCTWSAAETGDQSPGPVLPQRWWQRFFSRGVPQPAPRALTRVQELWYAELRAREARLQSLLAGLAEGYAMSSRKISRTLQQFQVEAIPVLDLPFDPDLMEVVEVVVDEKKKSGVVVEEVRKGYRWNNKIIRYAQVKVARASGPDASTK